MSRSVLSIRTSGSEKGSGYVRYVILEGNPSDFKVRDIEHTKLTFPKGNTTVSEKLAWLHKRLGELLEQNKDIGKIVLKSNENNLKETKALRLSTYYDSVILLLARQQDIPISQVYYNDLNTNSKNVQEKAKSLIETIPNPASEKPIADAIVAAHWGLQHFD
jgi:hypothetical protein